MSVELTIETVEETIVLELQDHVPAVLTIDNIPELRDELDSKVDKVEGYSLVADDEIGKLSTVEQYAQKNTVDSVAGKQGDVLLDKSDVGLSAVDNTADADKPVSTAVADALDDKVDKVTGKGLSDTNFTQAEKDKLGGVAVEATKNRADSLNADKVHTHAISDVTGLSTALLTKFDKTDIVQAMGQSTEKVMSQKAVTDLVGDVESVLVEINGEP